MKNRHVKTFLIFLIIIASFFLKNNVVFAKEYYACDYLSPLTYIDQYGHATELQLHLKYSAPTENGYLANFVPGLKYDWQYVSSTNSVNSFCLIKDPGYENTDYNSYNIGFKLNDNIINEKKEGNFSSIKINQQYINTFVNLEVKNVNSSYIMVYESNGALKSKGVSQEDYEKYLQNAQYQNVAKQNVLYNFITLKDINSDRYFSDDNDKCVYSCNITGIGEFEDKNNSIINYIKKSGGIIFMNPSIKEKYPNKKWNEFISNLQKEQNLDEKTFKDKMKVLNIDINDENTKTFNKVYYNATKDKWNKFMQEESKDNSSTGTSYTRRQYFIHWFENVSRYMFEDNVSDFKKYFDYLYAEKINEDGDYKKMSVALEGMIEYNHVETVEKSCLETYPCSPYCNGTISEESEYVCSGPAFDACTSGSQDYKNCSTAYKKCSDKAKKQCEGVAGDSVNGCVSLKVDTCLKKELGDDKYNELKDKQSTAADVLEKRRKAALGKISYNLYRISSPSLNIKFTGDYKVKCEDVVIFHDLYIILRIAAPILVVVFGSLDYAKAVLASDAEKMEKSKKKFPKRLILVVLFMLIPVVINLILSLYAKSTDIDVNSNLMYCILKG